MKNFLKIAVALAVAVPVIASAQGITNSKHDLSNLSATTTHKAAATGSGGTDQICIFCHTPHKSATQALIWNRAATAQSPGWAGPQTTAGGTTLPTLIGTESRVCLTCHDGSIALGDVNNSGGGSTTDITMTGGSNSFIMDEYRIAPAGNMNNNHPVTIAYAFSTANYSASSAPTGMTAAAATANYRPAYQNAACNTPSGLCTQTPVAAEGTEIRLYGTSTTNAGIECGSCHEVHNKYGATTSYFLRVTQAQSRICLSCHIK